jgi:hypothetical protein
LGLLHPKPNYSNKASGIRFEYLTNQRLTAAFAIHNDIPSLGNLLEMSALNLQGLFMKAGLGKLGLANTFFSFHASKFESLFCPVFVIQDACQATHHKVKGLKTKQWFIA